MKNIFISLIIFCFLGKINAQTAGTLTFTFTEVPQSSTYNGNAQHVLAVWVQSTAGTFIKTKLRYAGPVTSDHLPTWAVNSGGTSSNCLSPSCDVVDATTGATRSAWNTYVVSWDGKKGAATTGTLQPDGIYKVTIQSTWNHGSTGTATTSYTFTKGPSTDHQNPLANAYFSGITLNWEPAVVPTASLTSSTIKCENSSISFTDASSGSPTSWNWSFPGGTPSVATTSNVNVTYASAGTYSVILTASSANGTSAPLTQTFVVNPTPSVVVTNTSVCFGSSVNVTATGASSYLWSTGATTQSISLTPTATTNYTVIGSTANCSDTKTLSVTVNAVPNVSVSNSTICAGSTATLVATGANTYLWNTGATGTNLVVTPSTTTIYSVTGTSNFGCVKTVTASVNVSSAPTIAVNSTSVCMGSSVVLSASGVNTYTWSTGANTPTISVSPTANTVYTVNGHLSGCSTLGSNTVSVTVVSIPTITINSPTLCSGNTAILVASGASSYVWNTGALSPSISITPSITTNYSVVGTMAGCSNSQSVNIVVNALPLVNISAINGPLCVNSSTITLSGTPVGGIFIGQGVSGAIFNPSISGVGTFTISYSYTNNAGCSALNTTTVAVNSCTGIQSNGNDFSNLISFYPNPISTELNLELHPLLVNNSNVELYDMIGNLVTVKKITQINTLISFVDMPTGLYTVRLVFNAEQYIFKIVKQ